MTDWPRNPDLGVVIVNWNAAAMTVRCLERLQSSHVVPRRVVVVDNASRDDSAGRIQGAFPAVTWVQNDVNEGFAAACNKGIRYVLEDGADWVFLLNNDALVEPDTLSELLAAAARRPSAGLFGGRIVYPDGRIWCAGVDIGFHPNLQRLRGQGQSDDQRFSSEEEVDALTGCGLLIRSDVIETIGDLDEDFFVYVEDIDFAERARAAGFASVYVPTARMVHDASASTGGGYGAWRKYMVAYNVVLFLRKHPTPKRRAAFWILDVLSWPLLLLIACFRGRRAGALAKARGIWDAWRGRPMRRPDVPAPAREP